MQGAPYRDSCPTQRSVPNRPRWVSWELNQVTDTVGLRAAAARAAELEQRRRREGAAPDVQT
jgi:hypothetical protein